MDPHSFKNIIFDLGGVLLNLNFRLTENAFAELGMSHFETIYSKTTQTHFLNLFEKGLINPNEFRIEMKKLLRNEVSDDHVDKAWNAMLLDLPTERLSLLKTLKEKQKLYLLSNTNDIHFRAFTGYLKKTYGFSDLHHIFSKEYFSHKLGMRKPDAEIFELVLKENNLDKDRTLFIDDSIQNTEGARKCGIQVIHLEKGKTIHDVF